MACISAIALSSAAVTAALVVRFLPSALVLVMPGISVRSPFCSVWRASWDGRIKVQQEYTARRLTMDSHLIKREDKLALWATPAGNFWIPDGDTKILPILLAQESRSIYGAAGAWGVHAGDVVLDIGAYIGTWTKQALAQGAARVIAIEPSPDSIECLRRNLAPEVASGQVVIYPKGIWDSEQTLKLFANTSTGVGNSFVDKNDHAETLEGIPVTTVDRLAAELQLGRVDFIKADVKGATERVLRGAVQVILRDHPRIALSTEESADSSKSIAGLVHSIRPGYQMKCGPCLLDGKEIYTDVLFFR